MAAARGYCSPQDYAGRSICPAEARSCSQMLTLRLRRQLPENIPSINMRQPDPPPDHVLVSPFYKMAECGTTERVWGREG